MKFISQEWSEKHKILNGMIRKKDKLQEAKEMFFDIHGQLHASFVSDLKENSIADEIFDDLQLSEYAIMPKKEDETIAWVVWHTARIEDLTMNILLSHGEQIFDEQWRQKLNVKVKDTGNAWSDEEIMSFSKSVNIKELLNYRTTVGIRTREIVERLEAKDMKEKVLEKDLQKVLQEGGVTNHPDSIWLLDFWGKKDMAGLLLMPPTRHVTLHFNDCFQWKIAMRTKNNFYLV